MQSWVRQRIGRDDCSGEKGCAYSTVNSRVGVYIRSGIYELTVLLTAGLARERIKLVPWGSWKVHETDNEKEPHGADTP